MSRRHRARTMRRQRGGEIPLPGDSVVITRLDPMDPASPSVAVSKAVAEKEIFGNSRTGQET